MRVGGRMQEKAKVVRIDRDRVTVIPLDLEACMGCGNAECRKNGNMFTVINRGRFDLLVGSEIRVGAPAKIQLKQGLLAVGLPVLLAVGAYTLCSRVFPAAGDGLRTLSALAALLIGAFLGYRLSIRFGVELPEVTGVCGQGPS